MAEGAGRPPMVVTHQGGMRFGVGIRGHQVITDQPLGAGGEDLGPTPLELLGASLGSCVALYVQQFCHTRGLRYEGMRVEVRPRTVPGRIERFAVRVVLPVPLPPHYAQMLERVARSCPAHNTLTHGAAVDVAIEQPEAAAATA